VDNAQPHKIAYISWGTEFCEPFCRQRIAFSTASLVADRDTIASIFGILPHEFELYSAVDLETRLASQTLTGFDVFHLTEGEEYVLKLSDAGAAAHMSRDLIKIKSLCASIGGEDCIWALSTEFYTRLRADIGSEGEAVQSV
jgi:hypothetical protein